MNDFMINDILRMLMLTLQREMKKKPINGDLNLIEVYNKVVQLNSNYWRKYAKYPKQEETLQFIYQVILGFDLDIERKQKLKDQKAISNKKIYLLDYIPIGFEYKRIDVEMENASDSNVKNLLIHNPRNILPKTKQELLGI